MLLIVQVIRAVWKGEQLGGNYYMFVRNLCRVFCEIVLKHLQKCVLLMQGEQRRKILLMMTFRVPQEGNLLRQPLMCLFQRLYSFVSLCFIKNKCSTDVFIFSCLLGIWWNACYSSFFFFFLHLVNFLGFHLNFFFRWLICSILVRLPSLLMNQRLIGKMRGQWYLVKGFQKLLFHSMPPTFFFLLPAIGVWKFYLGLRLGCCVFVEKDAVLVLLRSRICVSALEFFIISMFSSPD